MCHLDQTHSGLNPFRSNPFRRWTLSALEATLDVTQPSPLPLPLPFGSLPFGSQTVQERILALEGVLSTRIIWTGSAQEGPQNFLTKGCVS